MSIQNSYASFDYNNDKCYVFNTGTKKGRYIAFLDNPSEIASGTAYDDFRQTRGLKYYINNKYIGDSTEAHLNYTFNGIDNVTLKIVAPYVFDFDEYKKVVCEDSLNNNLLKKKGNRSKYITVFFLITIVITIILFY